MKDDKKMDKLIKESLKMEQLPNSFTDKIMDQLEALDTKEDRALTSLLKKHAMDSPSLNFTSRVMERIENASVRVTDKPIIGKKAWYLISLFVSSIFIYGLFTQESNSSATKVIDGVFGKLDDIASNSLSFDMPSLLTSPLFGLSVFALSSLFFLDYFMRNRHISLKA